MATTEPVGTILLAAGAAALLGLGARRPGGRAAAGALAAGVAGGGALALGAGPAASGVAAALGAAGAAGGVLRAGTGRRAAGDLVSGVGASFAGFALRAARPPLGRTRAERALDAADAVRLERTVLETEAKTRAEIAVAVVGACGPEHGARARLAAWLAALALLAAGGLLPGAGAAALLGAQALAAAAGLAAASAPALRRALVGEPALEAAAERGAWRSFERAGLARSEERTGLLVFVALLEGRVAVVADEGIHRALGASAQEAWAELAERAAEGVRAGRAAEGIAAGLAALRPRLEEALPGPERPVLALPRAVRVEP